MSFLMRLAELQKCGRGPELMEIIKKDFSEIERDLKSPEKDWFNLVLIL